MNYENLYKSIKKEFAKHEKAYFEYAWREKIGEMLESESKYEKLVEWIDKELDFTSSIVGVFSPADRNEKTTIAMVNTYRNLMEKIAILIHCRELLLDRRSTTKMRENIEYTLCKFYNIKYSEELKIYV
jgi:hypothetical protein